MSRRRAEEESRASLYLWSALRRRGRPAPSVLLLCLMGGKGGDKANERSPQVTTTARVWGNERRQSRPASERRPCWVSSATCQINVLLASRWRGHGSILRLATRGRVCATNGATPQQPSAAMPHFFGEWSHWSHGPARNPPKKTTELYSFKRVFLPLLGVHVFVQIPSSSFSMCVCLLLVFC